MIFKNDELCKIYFSCVVSEESASENKYNIRKQRVFVSESVFLFRL